MLITVFTPTYNRAYRLQALYESLCRQTFHDFEWLIVDDGSTDDTESTVTAWIAEDRITIRYYKQPNGGKHRAINRGVNMAEGLLFFIVDSDDMLPPSSLQTIAAWSREIYDDTRFAGVVGCRVYQSGKYITQGFKTDYIDSTSLELRYRHDISGDMAEVVKTSVMKQYPFPEILNEKFVPEALIWNRIARDGYIFRHFNQGTYLCEYLPDGLTASIVKVRMNSPVAASMCYSELVEMQIPVKQKIKAAINYWRFRLCPSENSMPAISAKWLWTIPFGWLMHIKDNYLCK